MNRRFTGGIALALALTSAAPAAAQQRVERFAIAADAAQSQTVVIVLDQNGEPSAIRLIAGGLVGGVVGGAALGLTTASVGCLGAGGDICLYTAIPGLVLGEAIGMGLGVWFADEMRGSGPVTVLASFAGVLVGIGALLLTYELTPVTIPLVVAGQLAAVIAVERATGEVEEY